MQDMYLRLQMIIRSVIGRLLAGRSGMIAVGKLSISSFLATVITTLGGLYVARILEIVEYGRLIFFTNLLLVALLLAGLGLTAVIIAEIARTGGEREATNTAFYSLLALRLVTIIPLILFGLLGAALMHDWIYFHAALAASLAMTMDFLIGATQGLQKTNHVSASFLLQPSIYIIILILTTPKDTFSVIFILEGSYALAILLIALVFLSREIGFAGRVNLSPSLAWRALRSAGTIYLILLVQTLYTTYTLVWMGKLGLFYEVAWLGITFTIVRMPVLAMAPVLSAILFPRLNRAIFLDDMQGARSLANSFYIGVAVLSICVFAILIVYSNVIVELLYSDKYIAAASILRTLSPLAILLSLESFFTLTLIGIGNSKEALVGLVIRLVLVTAVIASTFTLEDIDRFRFIVYAYLISATIGLIISGYFYRRWSGQGMNLARLLVFTASCVSIAYAVDRTLPEVGTGTVFQAYKVGVTGILLAILAYIASNQIRLVGFNHWRSLPISLLLIIPFFVFTFSPEETASAQSTSIAACEISPINVGTRWIEIRCSPGFASENDIVRVYPTSSHGAGVIENPQIQNLSMDAVWIFDAMSDGTANLIIEFKIEDGVLIADIVDDQNGDNRVDFMDTGETIQVVENESAYTVRVVALDGYWQSGGKPSFNLDLYTQGDLMGAWWWDTNTVTRLFESGLLNYDETPEVEIHVRDIDHDGKPDYEWRQNRLPLPESPLVSGHYRTDIIVNTEDDEVPITNSLLWPYLNQNNEDYNKIANKSPAPIQVDWANSRLTRISEFVASRANPGNYVVYSINRVLEGETTATDFENPFAFYDLAGMNDGFFDLTVRFESVLPNSLLVGNDIYYPGPINIIQYAWDPDHSHDLKYQVSTVGRQKIDQTIKLPEFSFKAIPFEILPEWVIDQKWDAATFVEVEDYRFGKYWTYEVIYEWTVELGKKILPFGYITGIETQPPITAFSDTLPGFRGEYKLSYNEQPYLYYSPIDKNLHLKWAEGGVWRLDEAQIVRLTNLDGDAYMDVWSREAMAITVDEAGKTLVVMVDGGDIPESIAIEALYALDNHLLHTGNGRVTLLETTYEPSLFETLPPTDHDTWEAHRALLAPYETQRRDPTNLRTWLDPFPGPRSEVKGASLANLRIIDDGFRFELSLEPGFVVAGPDLIGLAAAEPGDYLVENRGGVFSLKPLAPAQLTIDLRQLAAGAPAQVTVGNSGMADVNGLFLVVETPGSDDTSNELLNQPIDALAGETLEALVTIPSNTPAGSALTARLEDATGTVVAEAAPLSLTGAPPAGRVGIFDIGRTPVLWPVVGAFAALLAAAGLMAVRRREETP